MALKCGLEQNFPIGGIMSFQGFFPNQFIRRKPMSIDTPILAVNSKDSKKHFEK